LNRQAGHHEYNALLRHVKSAALVRLSMFLANRAKE
jgi:hypothetical protein